MRRIIIALLLSLALAACGPSISAPPDTGVTGQVLVGPMCPVMIQGQPCPDQPTQATVQVFDASGNKVTEFQTDDQGRFTVNLAPGQYTLRPQRGDGQGMGNFGKDEPVTVVQGQFATVTLSIDSGIR